MRSPSRAAAALLALGVAFALLAVSATVSRSLIPHGIDAAVTEIEVRREKHPGIDDVWLVHLDDGRRLHADAEIARRLDDGAQLTKAPGQTQMTIDGTTLPLTLSGDAIGMLWVMPLTLITAIATASASLRMSRTRR
jgi:hypothetical protein